MRADGTGLCQYTVFKQVRVKHSEAQKESLTMLKRVYRLTLVLALALAATAPARAQPDRPTQRPPAPVIQCGGSGGSCP